MNHATFHTCARGLIAATLTVALCTLGSFSVSAQSLDDLLELDPAEPSEVQPQDPQATEADDETAALRRRLAELREQVARDYREASNALEEAVDQMDQVARLLSDARDVLLPTQRVQQQIMEKLDQMIEAAIQQAQQQQSSSQSQAREQDSGSEQQAQQSPGQGPPQQPQGNDPSQDQASPGSVTATGDTQRPIEELRQEWGALPPRLRDELTEGIGERFSPVYRLMTEAYYRRLAEEAGQ